MILDYQKYDFTLVFNEEAELPEYKGSTFRGGFGHAFKRVVCVFKKQSCQECSLRYDCAYSYIFETPPPKEAKVFNFSRYESIPHPFVIEPPETLATHFNRGEELSFSLVLIGNGIKYLPYFILAFEQLGEIGIGKGKNKYQIKKVCLDDRVIYDNKQKQLKVGDVKRIEIPEAYNFDGVGSSDVMLDFLTPVRIKFGRDLAVKLEFFILITNLLRRLMLLNYFHGEGNTPGWDHRYLIERAKDVTIAEDNLDWKDWERYSNRQKTRMKLGGLLGRVVYRGNVTPFLPALRAGEIFHTGKGTSFGLGKIKVYEL